MTTGSVLLAIALFLLAALFVARPFLLPASRQPRLSEREALQAEKEALLARIRALDFDAQTEKQDDQAYQIERQMLLQSAAVVTAQLDDHEEDKIDEAIEKMVAQLRQELSEKEGGSAFCPNCGTPVDEGDHFCANCGRKLT